MNFPASTDTDAMPNRNYDGNLVYDVGMQYGDDAAFYARKGFNVVSIEASPVCAKIARERYPDFIGSSKIKIVNAALSDSSGTIDFFICNEQSGRSTTDEEWVKKMEDIGFTFEKIEVPSIPLERVVAENGVPYYMKIDIEGYSEALLKSASELGIRPKYVSIELDVREPDDTTETLLGMGYTEFQLVSQRSVPDQVEPVPVREGMAVEPRFEVGNSGLFGDDLPNAWVSVTEFRRQLTAIRRQDLAMRALMKVGRNVTVLAPPMTQLAKWAFPKAFDWYDLHAR